MPERQVRFTEQFFDRLDELLPNQREAAGTPSATDFLLIDLPTVRDRLAVGYERNTLATEDPEIRVFIGSGVLVARFAIFAVLEGDVVEVIWLTVAR